MARTRKIETYSVIVFDLEKHKATVINNVSAAEAKSTLANLDQAKEVAHVFAGPEIHWAYEIAFTAEAAPTQQPVKSAGKKRGRKSAAEKDAAAKTEPVKGANGAGEKRDENKEQCQ